MKITRRYFPGLVLALLLTGGIASTVAQDTLHSTRPGVSEMLTAITPSVVNVSVTGRAALPQNPLLNDPYFRRFFEGPEQPQTRPTQSVGSGVIIDADKGYILTNHHVVQDAEEIEVTLQDKRTLKAKLLGSDEGTDIALLQVQAAGLKAIPLSDSDTLHVGDFVVAIGNPFGIGQTVTTGIVSALDRSGISEEGYEDFIQTDASINPGNSGGALVDYNGALVGINSAIIAPAGGNVGIGFAVPVNMAMSVVDQLVEYGEVRRGRLGVMIQDLTPDIVEALQLDVQSGAVVSRVEPGSPAAEAGIKAGDIILSLDGRPVDGSADLRNTIGLTRAGAAVKIGLLRDNRRLTVDAKVSESATTPATERVSQRQSTLSGVQLAPVPSSHAGSDEVDGVLVTDVTQGSRAWDSGLRPGDIITAVNRRAVDTVEEAEAALADTGGTLALSIWRDGETYFLILR
jgi:serine protease Do/serine protease DegQ